jgi:hypothetical protein
VPYIDNTCSSGGHQGGELANTNLASTPPICKADLPSFCLAPYRATIKNKFIIHFHQHSEIPVDAKGMHLTATKIYAGTAFNMYMYCQKNDLSQVWGYMWNCWYSLKQWPLWA